MSEASIFDNIAYLLKLHGVQKRNVEEYVSEIAEMFEIKDLLSDRPQKIIFRAMPTDCDCPRNGLQASTFVSGRTDQCVGNQADGNTGVFRL